ncbi:peroxidase-related enzyme [Actinomadura sp. DC4]|uniref:carboxymuconolactone decarboxylase family protein n=1 Tax=Actinomadura sp. DC4 TaxID=3055069 RepID=UPI0025AF6D92|nr:peroxidase-related enzyme [Actinomadura sp. DC4]MDN3355637.1 peroxidase-related enzyme [Actinomadura sp. DC4]
MPFLPSLPENAVVLDVMKAFPESSKPLIDYHEVVLRGPSALSVGERELIAAFVSGLNACRYCRGVHEAVAKEFGVEEGVLAALLDDVETSPVRAEFKPLFAYVRKLTLTPSAMAPEDAAAVFAAGWEEQTLYDAVSVCALFNFMNRLVEGLGVKAADDSYFAVAAKRLSSGADYSGYRGLIAHDHDA